MTTSRLPQIIGMGGGGFSMEPENPLLDRYVLKQAGKERPRICFIGTASGDSAGYIDRFYGSFRKLPCEPSHLALFKAPLGSMEEFVLEKDVIYVGGGNTRNLLALWREWGLDRILRRAWEEGVVLCGISAGSLCWFEEGVTDSIPGELTPLRGLGFLRGSNCPHYDGEAARRPAYHRLISQRKISGGYAADDGAALHFVGEELLHVVSSRPKARAFRVALQNEEIVEELIQPRYLGSER